ncbi:MAG TPA: hypothetical protein VFX98_19535 [Longimicrobiaceae bacterium]|nr:hypothetical protein [Longimicrobiaceae bacterium]
MEFFIDRNLGGKIFPGILQEAGIVVRLHDDYFSNQAPDEEWLPEVARAGWIVLSSDKGIRNTPRELEAVMRSGAALLEIIGGSAPAAMKARNFVNTFPKIERFVFQHRPPYIAKVYRPSPLQLIERGVAGDVRMYMTRDDWERRWRR